MTGTEPDAARAQKQHAFEQAMVQQAIEPDLSAISAYPAGLRAIPVTLPRPDRAK